MGPDEVLVWGGNVSVNGQLVPDGESRLLHGKGTLESRRFPKVLFTLLRQSALKVGVRRTAEGGTGEWEPAASPTPCYWKEFGNEGAR